MAEKSNKLSDSQAEEVTKWFDEHCTLLEGEDDQSGMQYITIPLLEQFFKDISFPIVEYSYYNIMKEIERMSIVNGIINKDNFFKLVNLWVISPKPIDELKVAFKVFDIENRGYINIVELQQILRSLGDKFTAEELREFAYDADMTGLGNVDCNAFVDSMFLVAPNLADIEVDFIYPPVKATPKVSIEELTTPSGKGEEKKEKEKKNKNKKDKTKKTKAKKPKKK